MNSRVEKKNYLVGIILAVGLVGPATLTAQVITQKADAAISNSTDSDTTRPPEGGSLRGVTIAPGGFSLSAVTVVVHSLKTSLDREIVTDHDGAFLVTDLEPGPYRITASKEGFTSAIPTTIEVARSRTVNASVELAQAFGSLRGVTTGEGSFSLGQVSLTIRRVNGGGPERHVISDADGVFKVYDLQPGKYQIMASREGFTPITVEISEHRTTNTNVLVASTQRAAESSATPVAAAAPAVPPAEVASDQRQGPVPATPPPPEPAPHIPEALEAPPATPGVDNFTPFAYGDFSWLNGSARTKDLVLDTKFFTPEVRFDSYFAQSFNQPKDHTLGGSTELFRSGEFQVEQASVGGDFHWQNVRGRILFMEGMFATTTPRNDPSTGNGQWDLRNAYRYVSEAYGGYHFNVNHGLNVDAGIFVSYIGLFSYYNFDNWTYQPSYVSSNTPWFFNGVRLQWFPTNKLKIEPWFINGWQSYNKFNGHPGLGGQLLWMPTEWFKLVANQYGYGQDNLGLPKTERIHTDDSIEIRFYNNPEKAHGISKIAMSLTADAGAQYGGGICGTCAPSQGKDSFVGWMIYNRYWWNKDKYAITFGGGEMSNWGRYLTLLPPINGADAVTGSVYFPEVPGSRAHMWDSTITFHYMPKQYITWWAEIGYRHSDIPYFAGRGGVTPPGFPVGGTNGFPQYYACMSGASSGTADLGGATAACSGAGGVWFPDLRRSEAKASVGVLVKF